MIRLNRWLCDRGNGTALATLLVVLIDPQPIKRQARAASLGLTLEIGC